MKSLGKGVVTWSYAQYRSNAKKEYNNFWRSFFRELIQNSNDAGASVIEFRLDSISRKITIEDDGCGMDLRVIQNKLLVIGGSEKAAGSVGGLGKAKELLFFSQPEWMICTNKHIVKGTGGEYEIFESPHPLQGTVITLQQPMQDLGVEWDHVIMQLKYVATRCHLKAKITLSVNNQPFEHLVPHMKLGQKVRELPEMGSLYFRKTIDGQTIGESDYLYVTINGCWMFNRYIGTHSGYAVFDIDSRKMNPVEGLTANRDALKSDYAYMLDALAEELLIDKKSAVEKRQPKITLIKGTGSIDTGPTEKEIQDMFNKFESLGLDKFAVSDQPVDQERATAFFSGIDLSQENLVVDAVDLFVHITGYEPDFIIREDPDKDEWNHARIEKFLETQKASTIAHVWTETLKQVLLDNKIKCRFTIGFIFDESQAMRTEDDHGEAYLINPLKVPPTGIQNKVEFMNYMRTTAVHEITHKFQRYHDETFMAMYHALEEKTWPNHRIYANIGKLR